MAKLSQHFNFGISINRPRYLIFTDNKSLYRLRLRKHADCNLKKFRTDVVIVQPRPDLAVPLLLVQQKCMCNTIDMQLFNNINIVVFVHSRYSSECDTLYSVIFEKRLYKFFQVICTILLSLSLFNIDNN